MQNSTREAYGKKIQMSSWMNSRDNWYGTRLHDEQVSVTLQGPKKGLIWGPKKVEFIDWNRKPWCIFSDAGLQMLVPVYIRMQIKLHVFKKSIMGKLYDLLLSLNYCFFIHVLNDNLLFLPILSISLLFWLFEYFFILLKKNNDHSKHYRSRTEDDNAFIDIYNLYIMNFYDLVNVWEVFLNEISYFVLIEIFFYNGIWTLWK